MQIHLPPQTLAYVLEAHGVTGSLMRPRVNRKSILMQSTRGQVDVKVFPLQGSPAASFHAPFRLKDLAPEVLEIVLNSAVKGPAWERRQREESSVRDDMKRNWLARQAKNEERFRLQRLQNLPGGILTQHLGRIAKGPGTREEAIALAQVSHAQPGAFFLGREYNARNLATYIGASNALLSMGIKREAHWAMGGWQLGKKGAGEDAYVQGLNTLRGWLNKEKVPNSSIREILQAQINMANVPGGRAEAAVSEALWAAAVAAHGVGDLNLGDSQRDDRPAWGEIMGLALPMRIITAEQVGLAFPMLSQRTINDAVHAWGRLGFLKVHDEEAGLTIWRVTEKAVQAGLAAGLMTPEEGKSRLVVRRKQEAHDLAVGDTLLLLTIQAAEMGITIQSVETETGIGMSQSIGLGQTAGMVPDLRLRLDMGPARTHQVVDVEVVGRGNNYKSSEKLNGVISAGMKVFSAGLDGCGVRHG